MVKVKKISLGKGKKKKSAKQIAHEQRQAREKKAKQKRLKQKKHQALLREHQALKAKKLKGKVVVKGKKKNIGDFETQKEDQKKNHQKKR